MSSLLFEQCLYPSSRYDYNQGFLRLELQSGSDSPHSSLLTIADDNKRRNWYGKVKWAYILQIFLQRFNAAVI